ncbi:hypothetical protein RDI58_026483 [Solanum bulbocastanum]|uniref:Uncharacterized protein n=1 Tax=Solanum bulbocastanum TaxID=147425 RepID=A0AAN8Y1H8_SOLBU
MRMDTDNHVFIS